MRSYCPRHTAGVGGRAVTLSKLAARGTWRRIFPCQSGSSAAISGQRGPDQLAASHSFSNTSSAAQPPLQQDRGVQPPAASAAGVAAPAQPLGMASDAGAGRVPSIQKELTAMYSQAIAQAFPDMAVPALIVQTTDSARFGDYQCNNAMSLFGRLRGHHKGRIPDGLPQSPVACAEAVLAAVGQFTPAGYVENTEIAGPGFINITLCNSLLGQRINAMLAAGGCQAWAPQIPGVRKALVDFSSPNVAKEMHVGHLRSTIIGDTICRLLEYCGVEVLRINHIGDWGTQFGMLIQHMAEMQEGGLTAVGEEDISDLQKLYKESKVRFDAEEDFKQRAREMVTKLQGGQHPEVTAAWQRICNVSRREFQAVYDRLDIRIQERGESFYNPALKDTVADLMERGIAQESDGAKCIFVKGSKQPLMIEKSDGGYGYATTDMAAIKQRVVDEGADWVIYVTDEGQAPHFKLVFAAAKMAGIIPAEGRPRVEHVGFGLVLGEDGKRFRTRSTEVVKLVDLLDEAKSRVRATIVERNGDEFSAKELEEASSVMGYAAVKYADLKNARLTNYKFNFDEMLNLKGNTAVYLLYAHARIASIARKAGLDMTELAKTAKVEIVHPQERLLALHVVRFPEAVEAALADLMPNRITEYLYDLSQIFSSFYDQCHVVGTPEQNSRLLLCEATAIVIRQCFSLLGMKPLYRI